MQVFILDNFLVFSFFFHIFLRLLSKIYKIYETEKVPLRIKCPKAEMLCNPQNFLRKLESIIYILILHHNYMFYLDVHNKKSYNQITLAKMVTE